MRIDQFFTLTLRYRLRFEHLGLAGTVACLHHQQPLGLLQFGRRYDIVTPSGSPAGAMIRRKKSVLFNIIPCAMPNLTASSFATFSHASRILSKAHSVALTSPLKMLFFLPITTFQREQSIFHSGRTISVRTTLYLFWVLFGRRLTLPSCIPSCFSFSASFINFFVFQSLGQEVLPQSLYLLVFSQRSP